MLINVLEGEEIRIAVLDRGELDQLHFETPRAASYLNNIYMGRIVNIEPSLGAAFVDFGGERNGFLHESDVVVGAVEPPSTAGSKGAESAEGRRTIRSLVRKGQSVVVQISRDGIGNKGPTLTTNLSIPGRYLVLMPYLGRWGVSRKIPDREERKRLKGLLEDLAPPRELGCIIRTAGVDRTKADLQKDLRYLLNLWNVISKRIENAKTPAPIYQESDIVIRTIRDYFTPEISRIVVDSENVFRKCRDFLKVVMPRYRNRVELFQGKRPLFHEYGVEAQIERTYRRRIELPTGGSVVIEPTEALVAVDVNSGKYREKEDPEETAFRTNIEAIPVIVRQFRLRDLGGLLIIDFIDMQEEKHRRAVEREVRAALKKDRARTKMTRMSEFGIIEITRQRVRAGLGSANFEACPHCGGTGRVKSVGSQILTVLRQMKAVLAQEGLVGIEASLHPSVSDALLNRKRRDLLRLEEELGRRIEIRPDPTLRVDDCKIREIRGVEPPGA
jgi:ribonuclease E